jgi:hypothetical protein
MARIRVKKGILEFSTNPERGKLIKKYVLEVRCLGKQLCHAYMIIGKKRKKDAE